MNMKYEEFRRNLGKAGLTNKQFAKLITLSDKSISNLSGRKEVPNHLAIIALLMGELADNGIGFKEKIDGLDLKKAKPRGKGFTKKRIEE